MSDGIVHLLIHCLMVPNQDNLFQILMLKYDSTYLHCMQIYIAVSETRSRECKLYKKKEEGETREKSVKCQMR